MDIDDDLGYVGLVFVQQWLRCRRPKIPFATAERLVAAWIRQSCWRPPSRKYLNGKDPNSIYVAEKRFMKGLQNRSFFQMRTEEKLFTAHPGGPEPQRGWSAVGAESISSLYRKGLLKSNTIEDLRDASTFSRVDCSSLTEAIIDVSETLQRWTNGTLPAGLHRVNLPKSLENSDCGTLPERYSIAYFCKADRSTSVGPLKHFVSARHDPVYGVICFQAPRPLVIVRCTTRPALRHATPTRNTRKPSYPKTNRSRRSSRYFAAVTCSNQKPKSNRVRYRAAGRHLRLHRH